MIDYLIRERYAVRKNGEPIEKTYDDVINRVINWYGKDPDDLFKRRVLIPATPVLMNAGAPTKHPCYFSCFPLGRVGDSLEEIMEMAHLMARIYRSGGGCGVDVSGLRPEGSLVCNGQGKASGPVSFLQIFDAVTGTISQGGRRRGALMIQCDATHPDVLKFVRCKQKEGVYSNMNISINVRDGDLRNEELLDAVAEGMWRNGEPGVIFIDNHLRNSIIPPEYEPIFTNPCAEYMSVKNSACNLITVNLVELLERGMDEERFFMEVHKCSGHAVDFGNFILNQTEGYPNSEIGSVSRRWRPVGVGVTGLYEVMMWFGIDAKDRPWFAEEMQRWLNEGGREASAKTDYHVSDLRIDGKYGNCYVTVQAPTGTTSLFGRVAASGIEPLFDLPMKRMVKDGDGWKEFEVWPRIYQEDFERRAGKAKVRKEDAESWLARNISVEEHLDVLEAVQKNCDAAISKTINVPSNFTVEDVKDLLRNVEGRGIKSFTLYRDESRKVQVLNKNKRKVQVLNKNKGKVSKDVCVARRFKVRGPQTCYVHISEEDGRPVEVFITAGKGGTVLHADNEAIGRLVSLILNGAPDLGESLCKHLDGIDAGMMYFCDGLSGKSVQDVLAKLLIREYFRECDSGLGVCPECGKMTLKREGGCNKCMSCTYSSC